MKHYDVSDIRCENANFFSICLFLVGLSWRSYDYCFEINVYARTRCCVGLECYAIFVLSVFCESSNIKILSTHIRRNALTIQSDKFSLLKTQQFK